ncbi:transporter substrate-binding domain-containing protein [Cohnella herbarum]|uniref:Transporter substrate-binding domain-containing protein n=1 Tax=Cohnella herbarum TaxID=2728023 RepID=A0A7Z2VRF7_9BACL|nr:transporter substrate-binding domain-containing protein [Cohnella herbarum]QJD87677.1 transporter substrate-binding domain-containing protein [Cohnella herbarum]
MKKRAVLSLVMAVGFTLLAGCGDKNNNAASSPSASATSSSSAQEAPSESSSESASESAAASTEAPVEAKKIIVGTSSLFPQVCFLDENGKLTGYDIELVREIDKRLPEYDFEFQLLDSMPSLLLSLETKKVDFVAHEIEKNPERTEKYLFNKVPYAHWKNKIVVSASNNDPIETLADLKGKKIITHASSAADQILKNYDKENPGTIKIVYQSGAANDTVQQIDSGRVTATVAADFSLSLIDPEKKLKTVGKALSTADILFLFRKNDSDAQVLADAIDKVLLDVKADGTLSALSKQWLGQDFTSLE